MKFIVCHDKIPALMACDTISRGTSAGVMACRAGISNDEAIAVTITMA